MTLAASAIFSMAAAEFLVRLYLFHCPWNHPWDPLGWKEASLYARWFEDDYWYFYQIWNHRHWTVEKNKPMVKSRQFSDNWAISLQPHPVLGYARKANVRVPGHETSNFGTRGIKDYPLTGPKILFYGNSWVESQAPSANTLPAKIERKSGIHCLNYGVGGYGLDQIYLLFDSTHRQFPKDCYFLIGIIDDDLGRMLLKVRTSPKPYYTAENSRLTLHTQHIDSEHPNRFFDDYRPRAHIFLYELFLSKTGLVKRFSHGKEREETAKIAQLTNLLIKKFREKEVPLGFVIFSDSSDDIAKQTLLKNNIPYLDIQDLLRKNGTPGPQGHPTPQENDVFADWIIAFLKDRWPLLKG